MLYSPSMTNLQEPVDEVHGMSARAIERIRVDINDAKSRAAAWDIRPVPKDFR